MLAADVCACQIIETIENLRTTTDWNEMPDSIRKEFFNLGEELIPAITEIHVGNLIAKKESLEAIDELIRKVSR